jgi:outer membrane protein assembly factor BamB
LPVQVPYRFLLATQKWSTLLAALTFDTGVESSPAIGADGTIYCGSFDGRLYAVRPDGSTRWSLQTADWVRSSPAIGADGTIYFGSWDDTVYAVSPGGTLVWSFKTGGHVSSSPAIGPDGTVYVGSWDGKLYALGG